jgi:hypothetical protein
MLKLPHSFSRSPFFLERGDLMKDEFWNNLSKVQVDIPEDLVLLMGAEMIRH